MYTDGPIFVVVGVQRAKRLLSVWRSVTAKMNLTMAIAAKHQGGVAAEWLGLLQLAHGSCRCFWRSHDVLRTERGGTFFPAEVPGLLEVKMLPKLPPYTGNVEE